jgi:fibronectin-binding autotransporter adhesin
VTLSNNVTAILANSTASAANVTTGNVIVLSSNLSTTVTGVPLTVLDGSVIANNGPAATSGTAILTVGADNSNQLFSGILADGTAGGNLALVKNGTGMLALNGANTYTGGTTLNAGTLAGSGSIVGTVTAGTAAQSINPGASGANSIGTLTLGGLTTNAHTTLAFDLGSPSTPSDLLDVTGPLTLATGVSIQISSQSVTGASSLGYYKVIQYGTLVGSAAGITLPAVANNIAYTLDTLHDPGFIDIHRGYIGDANDDGSVTVADLNTVLNNLGTVKSSWAAGNFDGAATIDLTDLNDVLNHIGSTIPTGSVVSSPAPEPASLSLLALGAAAVMVRRRRS